MKIKSLLGLSLLFVSSFSLAGPCEQACLSTIKDPSRVGDYCTRQIDIVVGEAKTQHQKGDNFNDVITALKKDNNETLEGIDNEFYRNRATAKCILKAAGIYDADADTAKVSKKAEPSENEGIEYFPTDKQCLAIGKDSAGHTTYTNKCKTPVMFGYCHIIPKDENDITTCKAQPNEFSRSGYSYITQAGGLKPGATHTEAYVYNSDQYTFLVACRNGRNALIESFDSKRIRSTSKAEMSCWAYKKAKK